MYSLEEQLHRAAAKLRNLRQQQAVVKMPDRYSVQITAEPVGEGYASAERVHAFQEKTFETCDFVSPIVMVEKQLADRRRSLEEAARQAADGAKEEPESFLE